MASGQVAVQFDHVSKRFNLRRDRPRSFQEMVVNLFRPSSQPAEEFWALRDVSFSVERGQVVGFIGANGAGKSSLLKLVNGILPPTEGRVVVNGRVSGLLELGAGFHPDLTGRENIYLNGSILGLSRRELDRLFPSIVAFSELDQFIDAPVKHYSSGMYMRLGFAVAIHAQPDILLVDEVLAVGDAPFQAKCMSRILAMKKQGVTILFVTHDMDAVRKLCDQAIWLDESRVRAAGRPDHVIAAYLDHVAQEQYAAMYGAEAEGGRQKAEGGEVEVENADRAGAGNNSRPVEASRWGTREVELLTVEFLDAEGQRRDAFSTGETFIARLHYHAHHRLERPMFGIAIHDEKGAHVTGPNTVYAGFDIPEVYGHGWVDYIVDDLPLLAGAYLFTAAIYDFWETGAYDHHDKYYSFRVRTGADERYGLVRLGGYWSHHGAGAAGANGAHAVEGLTAGTPPGPGQGDAR